MFQTKDLSKVNINNLVISDSEIGLIAFQKKSEFGPAQIDCIECKFINLQDDYDVENGSLINFNQ